MSGPPWDRRCQCGRKPPNAYYACEFCPRLGRSRGSARMKWNYLQGFAVPLRWRLFFWLTRAADTTEAG